MSVIFHGEIKGGKFIFDDRSLFDKYLSARTGRHQVEIKRLLRKRTTGAPGDKSNQNGYYYGVVIPILCLYFGYTPEEMDYALRNKFLRIGGTDDLPKIKSPKELNTVEWEDYMEQIRIWALVDYNITIPLPNEEYNLIIRNK